MVPLLALTFWGCIMFSWFKAKPVSINSIDWKYCTISERKYHTGVPYFKVFWNPPGEFEDVMGDKFRFNLYVGKNDFGNAFQAECAARHFLDVTLPNLNHANIVKKF
jgi:hypothetical protein